MSADDFALRNSTHMQNSPEVLSFSNIVKEKQCSVCERAKTPPPT